MSPEEGFELVQQILAIIGSIAVVATQTPNVSKNKGVQWVLSFINILGQNWGRSKNEKD